MEETAKRHARSYGFTFGAMGSARNNFYKDAYSRQGYREIVNKIQKLWIQGNRDQARDLVPIELALKSNLIGTDAMIKERLSLYKNIGVTTLQVSLPGKTVSTKIDALGRFEADDEVGFFFKGIKQIQEILNEFKIRKV